MLLTAEFRRYDVYTESWKGRELWKNKDRIIWIMPLVTNNSDTPGFAFCCHLPIKGMGYISFHLIGADGCSTVQHHLQLVIVLPSHWHTVYITSLFQACTYFTKMPQRWSSGTLRATTGKDEAFPPVPSFMVLNLTKPLGCHPKSLQNKQMLQNFKCGKAEKVLVCPSNLPCSICF